jgi:hypothetical protein
MTRHATQVPARPLWPLWLLVLLFALPPLLGWLFFLNPEWLPQERRNNGLLLQPARSIASLALTTADGNPFHWEELKGKWSIVAINGYRCDSTCQQRQIRIRQLRRALGANRQRVERLLILRSPEELPSLDGLEGTRLLLADFAADSALQEIFQAPGQTPESATYLIDPLGTVMMAHADSTPPKLMLEDLETLLKASQNWVKGAQYGHQ